MSMSHKQSPPGIVGQRSKRLGLKSQFKTRSVRPRSSVKYSFMVTECQLTEVDLHSDGISRLDSHVRWFLQVFYHSDICHTILLSCRSKVCGNCGISPGVLTAHLPQHCVGIFARFTELFINVVTVVTSER